MNAEEQKTFDGIVSGFEEHFHRVNDADGMTDNPMIRTAFYGGCLTIVRDGPEMESKVVQAELVKYYDRLRDQEYRKIRQWLGAGGGERD